MMITSNSAEAALALTMIPTKAGVMVKPATATTTTTTNSVLLGDLDYDYDPSALKSRVECSEAGAFLDSLPARSVKLIFLDPPYYKIKNEAWDHQWATLEDYLAWLDLL